MRCRAFERQIDAVERLSSRLGAANHVERVIGSIRRECLDHIVILNERHLRHVLSSCVHYYQETRTHLSLDRDCALSRPIQHRSVGTESPSQKSVACIIATNGSLPDSYQLPLTDGCAAAGLRYRLTISVSEFVRSRFSAVRFEVQTALRLTSAHQFDGEPASIKAPMEFLEGHP